MFSTKKRTLQNSTQNQEQVYNIIKNQALTLYFLTAK